MIEDMQPVLPSLSFMTCSSDDTIRIWNLDPHMAETESCKRNVYSNVSGGAVLSKGVNTGNTGMN